MNPVLLLGASGYIGSAFRAELQRRGVEHVALSRPSATAPTDGRLVWPYDLSPSALDMFKPSFVINAAAFVPQPSVDLCGKEGNQERTLRANLLFPVRLAMACRERGVPLGHISTGCLYDESREWTEEDKPTRQWNDYCGVYVRTKYMAELVVGRECQDSFIWRIRLPFDEVASPRNYLSKLRSFSTIWEQTNSLTHRGDFVRSALDMIQKRSEWGTYHMVNAGAITVDALSRDDDPHALKRVFIKGPVPGCTLSTAKLAATGCGMRPVQEAVAEALREWRTTKAENTEQVGNAT